MASTPSDPANEKPRDPEPGERRDAGETGLEGAPAAADVMQMFATSHALIRRSRHNLETCRVRYP